MMRSKHAADLTVTVLILIILGLAVAFLGFNILFKSYKGVKEQTDSTQTQILGTTCRDPGAGLLSDAESYRCACSVFGGEPSGCIEGRVKQPSRDCPTKCDKDDGRNDYSKALKDKVKEYDKDKEEEGDSIKERTYFGECCALDEAGNVIG